MSESITQYPRASHSSNPIILNLPNVSFFVVPMVARVSLVFSSWTSSFQHPVSARLPLSTFAFSNHLQFLRTISMFWNKNKTIIQQQNTNKLSKTNIYQPTSSLQLTPKLPGLPTVQPFLPSCVASLSSSCRMWLPWSPPLRASSTVAQTMTPMPRDSRV